MRKGNEIFIGWFEYPAACALVIEQVTRRNDKYWFLPQNHKGSKFSQSLSCNLGVFVPSWLTKMRPDNICVVRAPQGQFISARGIVSDDERKWVPAPCKGRVKGRN